MRRHELTAEHYQSIPHLLPENGDRGGPWEDHHRVLNGLFWQLRTGCPWRDIPERFRRWLCRRHIGAVIPQRTDQKQRHRGRPMKFDENLYRRRNVVERCVGWLKKYRAVATRFEKLARHYLGMVKLAMIQRYLRLLDSSYRP